MNIIFNLIYRSRMACFVRLGKLTIIQLPANTRLQNMII